MRIGRREVNAGTAALGLCGTALGLVLWLGADSQSRVIAEGGSTVVAKTAAAEPFAMRAPETNESSAQLWTVAAEPKSAQFESALRETAPPTPNPNGPPELWMESPAEGMPEASTAVDGSPAELWVETAAAAQETSPAPGAPSYRDWIKSRAEAGEVGPDGRQLYRFDLWLNAPVEDAAAVAMITYDLDAPAEMHKTLASADRGRDFKVQFAAASCPKQVSVELTFNDGRTERHRVDGCAILQ